MDLATKLADASGTEYIEGLKKAMTRLAERPGMLATGVGVAALAGTVAYSFKGRLPFPGPVYGKGLHELSSATESGKFPEWLSDLEARYGNLVAIQGPMTRILFIFDPEEQLKIYRMSEEVIAPLAIVEAFKSVNGPNPFGGNGELWKRHRRAIGKVVAGKHIRYATQVANEKFDSYADRWSGGRDEFIVGPADFMLLAQHTSFVQTFGRDADVSFEENEANIEALDTADNVLFKRFGLPSFLFSIAAPKPECVDKVNEYLRQKVLQCIARRDPGSSAKKRLGHDLIDALLEETEHFSMDELVGMAVVGFACNRAAPGAFTALLCYLLDQHPEVVERARKEMRDTLGSDADCIKSHDDLSKLEYLSGIVRELFRYYLVIMFMARDLVKDAQIGGQTVPAGTTLYLPCPSLLWNEKYYKDARSFKPERWLNAKEWFVPGTWPAFGEGPRACPGARLGQNNVKVMAAYIISHFDVKTSTNSPVPRIESILSRPPEDLKIHFRKRT